MSNTMKVIIRTILILVIMIAGGLTISIISEFIGSADKQLISFPIPEILMYVLHLAIGVVIGSLVSPRFKKGRGAKSYLIPLLVFLIVGIAPVLYFYLPSIPFSWIFTTYFSKFTYLAWVLAGLFAKITLR